MSNMSNMNKTKKKFLIASTGGSGSGYLLRLLYHLADVEAEVHWVATDNFSLVMQSEFDTDFSSAKDDEIIDNVYRLFNSTPVETSLKIKVFSPDDLGAPPASGSANYDGMCILPCSMKTLGAVASGLASNLIERSADVSLKERRKLILAVRETPYNLVHIENMKRATLAGATIMPASPGFYHKPKTIEDIYDFLVDRIFIHLGIDKRIIAPWGEST
ncbi:MAG: UbiX family flavin prenyltransferase [Leptospirales bacterium]